MSMDNTVPVKIITQHDRFLARLVKAGIYASKSEANRAGILLLMEKYPQFSGIPTTHVIDPTDDEELDSLE